MGNLVVGRDHPSSGEAWGAIATALNYALGVTLKKDAFRKQTCIERITIELHYPGFSSFLNFFPGILSSLTNKYLIILKKQIIIFYFHIRVTVHFSCIFL